MSNSLKDKIDNKLALGTAQFGLNYGVANSSGQVTKEEAGRILELAKEVGITTLDTAIGYGESEQVLGELGVDDFQVITKIPPLPEGLEKVEYWVDGQIKESLSRLRVPTVYGVLLHRCENLQCKAGEKIVNSLERHKTNGLVQKIGASIYDPNELEQIEGIMDVDLIQAPFNILDRRLETSGWLQRLNLKGVEIHIRSVFLQGLMLMTSETRPNFFHRWRLIWEKWEKWLEVSKISSLGASVRFPLNYEQIDRVIVGIDSVIHLKEILAEAEGNLPALPSDLMTEDIALINPSNWKLT